MYLYLREEFSHFSDSELKKVESIVGNYGKHKNTMLEALKDEKNRRKYFQEKK
jgi:hypothetical protein